jgi:hypothetical protein
MDSFTLVVFLVLIMIALQSNIMWAAIGLVALLVLSMKSLGLLVLTIVGILVVVMFKIDNPFVWVILAAVIVGIFILKRGETGAGPEMYSPEMMLGGG